MFPGRAPQGLPRPQASLESGTWGRTKQPELRGWPGREQGNAEAKMQRRD